MNNIKVSLNISTYNWPQALNLCLLSVKAQKVLPAEVVIADDGSTEETKKLIEQFQRGFPVPIIHVWQPDEGFQLARIRNKAIAASTGNYIIQVDGDLILHPRFVSDHISFAKKHTFTTGSRVLLNAALSAELLENNTTNINPFQKGISNRSNGYRIKFLRNYLADRYRVNDLFYMRGCNMAFWREDLIRVNGYNEDFNGWGREDNEIAVRLVNSGVRKRALKFGAIVYHIFHQEKERTGLDANEVILKKAIDSKTTSCVNGVNQYL